MDAKLALLMLYTPPDCVLLRSVCPLLQTVLEPVIAGTIGKALTTTACAADVVEQPNALVTVTL